METETILQQEKKKYGLKTIKGTALHKRLLQFEKNIKEGKKFTRKDLGI